VWRASFHKQKIRHYLQLFVDAVAFFVNHILHSVWKLPAKTFNVMVVVDVLHNALQTGRVLLNCFSPQKPEPNKTESNP